MLKFNLKKVSTPSPWSLRPGAFALEIPTRKHKPFNKLLTRKVFVYQINVVLLGIEKQ